MKIASPIVVLITLAACRRDPTTEQEKLERACAEKMTGATLAGRFGSRNSDKLHEDRYAISKVSKLAGNVWSFQARIQYGGYDVNVPVPVEILWAGDTPVVTMTNAGVPGMGKFTVRLLFYGDEYAGTWSNDHGGGGTMFVRIE